MNTFGKGRAEALAAHPTVKPVALVADALLDCTARGDVVLDQFAGSGTTILAAEKVGRIAYALEYEPRYIDVAILRWMKVTKLEATLAGDGRTFEDVADARTRSSGEIESRQFQLAAGQSRSTRPRDRDATADVANADSRADGRRSRRGRGGRR